MKALFFIGTICVLVAVAGAGRQGPLKRINLHVYREGSMSHLAGEKREVIRTQAELQKYWTDAFGREAGETPKDVDFSKDQLIAIHIGRRPTTDFSVVVDNVTLSTKATTITFHEVRPHGMMVAHHVTSPFIIIRIPIASKPLVFEFKPVTPTRTS